MCSDPVTPLARLGGDEFAILLEGTEAADAVELAERVLTQIGQTVALVTPAGLNVEVALSASIGVAAAVGRANSVELLAQRRYGDVLGQARRKELCARVYSTDMHEVATERFRVSAELRHAIERDEFRVHYQPLVDLNHGSVVGFEALLRWQHPTRGLLPPDSFIPLAEENGAIVEIGRWVLNAAARDIALLNARSSHPMKVNVNLSPRQLRDTGLVATVRRVLRDHALNPSYLVLEITETAFIDDSGDAKRRSRGDQVAGCASGPG